MTTNHLRRIFAAMLLLLALCGLGACTFHEVEEIEVIHAPEGDGTIVVRITAPADSLTTSGVLWVRELI